MYKEICNICGEIFESELSGKSKTNLIIHVRKAHKLTQAEYVCSGSLRPTCGCGCGKEVKIKGLVFNKYHKDHKNKMPMSEEAKEKTNLAKNKTISDYWQTLLSKLDKEKFQIIWERYVVDKDYNMDKVSLDLGFDKRSIRDYWYRLGIASKEELNKQSKLHKSIYSKKPHRNGYKEIDVGILEEIKKTLETNPKQHSVLDIKLKFAVTHPQNIILKRLYEYYTEEYIKPLFATIKGNSSIEEIEFGKVLGFYFGTKNLKTQFKLKYFNDTKNKNITKHYDFCLFDKLLIEYDGEYWHNKEQGIKNDALKNKLAIDNGYMIYRVASKEAKNIDILLNIKRILNEL